MAMAETVMRGNFLVWRNPFPHMVTHHATRNFYLVLPQEKLHGATLKIPFMCEDIYINGLSYMLINAQCAHCMYLLNVQYTHYKCAA